MGNLTNKMKFIPIIATLLLATSAIRIEKTETGKVVGKSDPIYGSLGPQPCDKVEANAATKLEEDLRSRTAREQVLDPEVGPSTDKSIKWAEKALDAKLTLGKEKDDKKVREDESSKKKDDKKEEKKEDEKKPTKKSEKDEDKKDEKKDEKKEDEKKDDKKDEKKDEKKDDEKKDEKKDDDKKDDKKDEKKDDDKKKA